MCLVLIKDDLSYRCRSCLKGEDGCKDVIRVPFGSKEFHDSPIVKLGMRARTKPYALS